MSYELSHNKHTVLGSLCPNLNSVNTMITRIAPQLQVSWPAQQQHFSETQLSSWVFYQCFCGKMRFCMVILFWLAEKILRGKKNMLTNRKNCEPHCQPCLVHLGKIAFGIASWGRNVDTPQSPTGGFTLTCWKRMLGHLIIQSDMDFRKNHLPMHNEKKLLATLSVLRLRKNITFENASKSSIISLTPYILEMIMIKLLKNQHEPSPLWMCNLCKVDTLTK